MHRHTQNTKHKTQNTNTDTQTHRHTDTQTHRHTDTHTHTHTDTHTRARTRTTCTVRSPAGNLTAAWRLLHQCAPTDFDTPSGCGSHNTYDQCQDRQQLKLLWLCHQQRLSSLFHGVVLQCSDHHHDDSHLAPHTPAHRETLCCCQRGGSTTD